MSGVFVCGLGAVSPAGWGAAALRAALEGNQPLPTTTLTRPGCERSLMVRAVPPPSARPAFLAHPRLRRASLLAQHVVAAALEALGEDATRAQSGALRLGVVVCLMAGCVAYSRRFYEEALRDPTTASPLVFPETVFNAPASHLASYLGAGGINYTLVGDDGAFLLGLALAAEWLAQGQAEGCVVIGAEESDWVVTDALRLFQRKVVHSSGAGALYLKSGGRRAECGVELAHVTDSFPFASTRGRAAAAQKMRAQLPANGADELLCLGSQNVPRLDAAELSAWSDWRGPRLAPKQTLGEAFTASAAWQCVAACDALQRGEYSAASVSVIGINQQAIGARFVKLESAGEP